MRKPKGLGRLLQTWLKETKATWNSGICTESSGLDDEHKKTEANGSRRAVQARRKDPGRKPAAPLRSRQAKEQFMGTKKDSAKKRQWARTRSNGGRRRKSKGGRKSTSSGSRKSKSKPLDWSTATKCVSEEQSEETRVESTEEPEVTSRFAEVTTRRGRGSDGIVRGKEHRCQTDETSRKGKGKGTGGKGEHDSKGGEFGGKGAARTMKSDDEAEEEKRGTPRLRYSECEDNEGEGRKEATEGDGHEPTNEQERARGDSRRFEKKTDSERRARRAKRETAESEEKARREEPPGLEDVKRAQEAREE